MLPSIRFLALTRIDIICHSFLATYYFPVSYKVATPIVANQIDTFTTVSYDINEEILTFGIWIHNGK